MRGANHREKSELDLTYVSIHQQDIYHKEHSIGKRRVTEARPYIPAISKPVKTEADSFSQVGARELLLRHITWLYRACLPCGRR